MFDISLLLPPADTITIPLLESLELSEIDDLEDNQDFHSFVTALDIP